MTIIGVRLVGTRLRDAKAPHARVKKIFCAEHGLQEVVGKRRGSSDWILACQCIRSIPRPRREASAQPLSLLERTMVARAARKGVIMTPENESWSPK